MDSDDTVLEFPSDNICPKCGTHIDYNASRRYKGHEGDYGMCYKCGQVFAYIRVGSMFTVGLPGAPRTVYEIEDIHPTVDMIRCIEIAKVGCSPLAKINNNRYLYPTRAQILCEMRRHFVQNLVGGVRL